MSGPDQDILKILYSEEQIQTRVRAIGRELAARFEGKRPLFTGVLKGSVVFLADLIRACPIDSELEFIGVSSYGNATKTTGVVKIQHDLQQDVTGRELIIVEDILDSGHTLHFLRNYLLTKGAANVTIAVLLDKPSRREKAVTADYVGFVTPDEFVVGYGLDYRQRYRNLPYIGVLKPECV